MDYEEYLRRLPKVELHCHVEGTLRPATVVDLARKHDIALPTDDVDRIYDYATIYEFLEIFRLVNSTVIDRDDFARVAYESLEDGVKLGNLKYREMFFNPTLHTIRGVPMATVVDGLIDGARAAEADYGVRCFLIADVYRQDPVPMAMQMTEEVIALGRDEVIGLGMDAAEAPDPPEQFAECFALAGEGRSAPHQPRVGGRAAGEHHHAASTCSAASGSTTATTSSPTRRWSIGAATTASTSRAAPRRPRWSTAGPTSPRTRSTGCSPPACSCTSTPTTPRCSAPTSARSTSTSWARTATHQRWRRPWCSTASTPTWLDPSDKASLRAAFEAELAALDAELAVVDVVMRAVMMP